MISPRAMNRHSSMQTIKNNLSKKRGSGGVGLSVSSLKEDSSFIIKSIKASTRHHSNIKQQSTQIGGQYVKYGGGEQYKLESNQQSSQLESSRLESSRLAMLRVGNISSHQPQDHQDHSKLSNEHSSVVSCCNLMPAIIGSNKNS